MLWKITIFCFTHLVFLSLVPDDSSMHQLLQQTDPHPPLSKPPTIQPLHNSPAITWCCQAKLYRILKQHLPPRCSVEAIWSVYTVYQASLQPLPHSRVRRKCSSWSIAHTTPANPDFKNHMLHTSIRVIYDRFLVLNRQAFHHAVVFKYPLKVTFVILRGGVGEADASPLLWCI